MKKIILLNIVIILIVNHYAYSYQSIVNEIDIYEQEYALRFSPNNYVRIPNNLAFENLQSITFEFWTLVDDFRDEAVIGTEYFGTGWHFYPGTWAYVQGSAGAVQNSGAHAQGPPIIQNNRWTHVAIVFDHTLTENNFKIFIDGLITEQHTANVGIIGDGEDIVINRHTWATGSSSRLNGMIDEFRLSNIARYDQNFNPSVQRYGNDENTIILLHFNEGSGSIIHDSSGNNLHGQVIGSLEWDTNTPMENSDEADNLEFELNLTISDALPNAIDLIVGTDSSATSGFDVGVDQLAPPPPPSGSFDARIKVDAQSYFTFFQPPTVEKTEWTLEFVPETGYAPITLSWDISDLPVEGRMTLTDVIDGSFVNVDMSEQSSLTIEESFITQLTLTHQLTVDVTETYRANWDLVGLPVELEHEGYAELFPSSNANTLYGYDGTYSQAQTLTAGEGYWLNFVEQNEVTLTGFPIRELDLDLRTNWNLISGLSESTVMVDEGGIVLPGSLYGYDGTYSTATTLEPGNGYWVATLEARSVSLVPAESVASGLALSGNSIDDPRQDEVMLSQAMMIEFEQEGVSLLPLVAGATIGEQYHPLQLSLPPAPPAGSVDARFDNNRWITEDSQVRIQLQQNDEPLHVVVRSSASSVAGGDAIQDSQEGDGSRDGHGAASHPFSGVEILFMDEGRLLGSMNAAYGERIQVPHQADQLMIMPSVDIEEHELPAQFALEQNYPNPFNPTTTIRYALPEPTEMTLEVYTISGQKLASLISGTQSAGWHQVQFDASGLTSGVYFYRLKSNDTVLTRKFTIVK